jgi:glycosyltransferase involved in cell wall biosynthesis
VTQANHHAAPPLPRLSAPTVAIVICCYNHERFVAEAIESALSQSLPCEVVVVDDGSTDGSRIIIEGLAARHAGRVTIVLQPNGGQLGAYAAGLAKCRAQVVVFLDSDDVLEFEAARVVAGLFDQGVAKVHFRMNIVGDDGRATGTSIPASLARGDVLSPLKRHGVLYASAPGSGNAYRRSVLDMLFPLPEDPSDRVAADFFTIYGSVAFGGVAAHEGVLARYRVHGSGGTAEPLVFGNAALGNDEAAKVERRYARLRRWVAERTDDTVLLAPTFLDFSVLKSVYASAVLSRTYVGAWTTTGELRGRLLKSLWLQQAYGLKKKIALTAWALLVLAAPRPLAFKLARYVCNPGSRA